MVYERLQKLKNESGQSILACNALVWLDIARGTHAQMKARIMYYSLTVSHFKIRTQ